MKTKVKKTAAKRTSGSGAVPSRVRIRMSPGDMLRTIRELQEMSQADLAKASGIPQPTLSAIESGRVRLGDVRAERLARALTVHPAVLLWPDYEVAEAKHVKTA
jgi:transcriptional regulator with XRE-family HTH domain